MARSMMHECFYASGTYSVPEMGIYAGWVAHENSFAAAQVFFNERKDIDSTKRLGAGWFISTKKRATGSLKN